MVPAFPLPEAAEVVVIGGGAAGATGWEPDPDAPGLYFNGY